jgi:peptide/nickel transport system substrate-binding protein
MSKEAFMVTIRAVASTLVIMIFLLAGCSPPTPTSTQTTTSAPPAATITTNTPRTTATSTPTGPYGEFKIAVSTLGGERFNPKVAKSTEFNNFLSPFFDTLVRIGPDGALAPGIAENWKMAANGLSWDFQIRKSVTFHNGTELTPQDVKFSIEQHMSKDAIAREAGDNVDHIEIVNDNTLRIYTKGLKLYLPYVFQDSYNPVQGAIMPKDYIQKNGMEYFERHPVGSGPFKLVQQVPGDMIQFQALTSHWRGFPSFKTFTSILAREETTRVAMLQTGAVDGIDISIESSNQLESAGFRTYSMLAGIANVYLYGAYHKETAGMPIVDIRVRQALSLAINRDEVRKTYFYGKAGPPSPGYITADAVDVDVPYWMDYVAKAYRYDPVESKRLLKEAGYGDGFSIKLWTYTQADSPYLPKLAEIVQGYWKAVGVNAEIVPVDLGVFRPYRVGGPDRGPAPQIRGQASTHGTSPIPIASNAMSSGWHHRLGSVDLLGLSSPTTDWLDSAAAEIDPVKRKELLAKVIKYGVDSYTDLTIATVPAMSALGPRVDIKFPKVAYGMATYADIAKHR